MNWKLRRKCKSEYHLHELWQLNGRTIWNSLEDIDWEELQHSLVSRKGAIQRGEQVEWPWERHTQVMVLLRRLEKYVLKEEVVAGGSCSKAKFQTGGKGPQVKQFRGILRRDIWDPGDVEWLRVCGGLNKNDLQPYVSECLVIRE